MLCLSVHLVVVSDDFAVFCRCSHNYDIFVVFSEWGIAVADVKHNLMDFLMYAILIYKIFCFVRVFVIVYVRHASSLIQVKCVNELGRRQVRNMNNNVIVLVFFRNRFFLQILSLSLWLLFFPLQIIPIHFHNGFYASFFFHSAFNCLRFFLWALSQNVYNRQLVRCVCVCVHVHHVCWLFVLSFSTKHTHNWKLYWSATGRNWFHCKWWKLRFKL